MKNEDGGGSTLTVVELDTAHAEAAPPRSAWISASFRSHHGVVVDISDSRAARARGRVGRCSCDKICLISE